MMRDYWIFISSAVLLISFFGILCSSFLIFRPAFFNDNKEDVKNIMYDYKMSSLDPVSNEVTVGFVSLPHQRDFVSYYNEGTGKYHLISNFEDEEYRCTGFCYCHVEDIEDRRSIPASNNLIRRGFTFLIASTTAMVAVSVAKKRIEEECTNSKYFETSTCQSSSITSEIESCQVLQAEVGDWRYRKTLDDFDATADDDEDDDDDEDEEEIEVEYDEEFDRKVEEIIDRPEPGIEAEIETLHVPEAYDGVRITHENTGSLNEVEDDGDRELFTYFCKGNCMNARISDPSLEVEKKRRDIDCEKITLEKKIRFIKKDMNVEEVMTAKKVFVFKHLRGLCKSKNTEFTMKVKLVDELISNKVHLCSANLANNKSIKCLFYEKHVYEPQGLDELRKEEPELFHNV